jgi:uridine phosphorylase
MPDALITPCRGKGEPAITGPVLFFVNPGDASSIAGEAKRLGAEKHFLFHSNLFALPGEPRCYWAGPALGAPAAVMVLEKLIALGATKIIIYGWCGSLVQSLRAGDIFLPSRAFSEEGTSVHYPVAAPPEPHPDLHRQLAMTLAAHGHVVRPGPIWTTDAPYRETRQKIRDYGQRGIMAVDMEFSALCTVAAFRGVSLAGAMLVSDELFHESWRPHYQNKDFKRKSMDVFHMLSDLLPAFL